MPDFNPRTVILRMDSDKKHSVLFKTAPETINFPSGDKPAIDSLYLKRPFANGVKKIKVTIEVEE